MKKLDNSQTEKINGGLYGFPISETMMCAISTALIFKADDPLHIELGLLISSMFNCAN